MAWQVSVDRAVCLGSGMCAALAPELFELDDFANPVNPDIEPNEVALDAADQCPAQAISVRENGVEIGPRP
ncbi:ferredoxin [Actinophytocola sp. KF-1]